MPKSVIPSYYGIIPSDSGPRHVYGDNSIHNPSPGISIANPMAKDGTVEDWDTAMALWEYAITSRLTNPRPGNPLVKLNLKDDTEGDQMAIDESQEKPLEENPVLMTETGWNAGKGREKSIEIAMESWGCPAFWLARNGVCATYAAGKASALVVDMGASSISITPVHDGLVLRKGALRSPLAGNFVSDQLRLLFSTSSPPVPLTPHYLVSSKTPVDAGSPAVATYRSFAPGKAPDASFRRLQEERLLAEFKESVVKVWSKPGRLMGHSPAGIPNEQLAKDESEAKTFEMPDGWNQKFELDRYRAAEGIFDVKAALTAEGSPPPPQSQGILAIIQASLAQVDVDIRPHLLSNVVVTGGASLMQGFTDRLNHELATLYPGPRVRISAPGNLYERKYASWIGGSILASLGTFHQVSLPLRD